MNSTKGADVANVSERPHAIHKPRSPPLQADRRRIFVLGKRKDLLMVRTVWPTASGHLFSPAEQSSRRRRSTPRKLILVKREKKLFL